MPLKRCYFRIKTKKFSFTTKEKDEIELLLNNLAKLGLMNQFVLHAVNTNFQDGIKILDEQYKDKVDQKKREYDEAMSIKENIQRLRKIFISRGQKEKLYKIYKEHRTGMTDRENMSWLGSREKNLEQNPKEILKEFKEKLELEEEIEKGNK